MLSLYLVTFTKEIDSDLLLLSSNCKYVGQKTCDEGFHSSLT